MKDVEEKNVPERRTEDIASESLSDALRLSFNIIKVLVGIVAVLFLTSGVFVVEQHEAGVILRFGKPVDRVLEPGLHWAWPFLIDEHIKIPVGRVHTIETGFMPMPAARERLPEKLRPGADWYLLTGDANIIHSRWLVRYRITDPLSYMTSAVNPEKVLKGAVENAVIRSAGGFDVDQALRTNVDGLRRRVQSQVADELNILKIGIFVEGMDIESILPPPQVRDAFISVILAEQERSERISEARAYYNRLLSGVHGEAARRVTESETYKTRIIEKARADKQYIEDLLKEYPDAPDMLAVFLNQIYLDVISEVLAGADEKFVIERDSGKQREIRYMLGRERGR